jgi:MFS family permease
VFVERRVPEPILPPRLFRQRTFVLCGIAGFFVGMAMFGALSYLPLYLQIVKGESATVSGLLTVPLIVGLLTASIGSGQLITRLGRWKIFPFVGLLLVACGLYLLSRLHVGTSLAVTGCFMVVLGLGVGMTLQVLVLAVQNTVARRDIGIATSAASFFRSMGGAVGVAIFGAILNNRLLDVLPRLLEQRHVPVPASGSRDFSALLASPQDLRRLSPPILDAIREGFTESLHAVFLVGAPLAILGWIAVTLVREVPLRTHVHREAEPELVGD